MWIDYGERIEETTEELLAREHSVCSRRAAVRVKLLRLLKSGQARSLWRAAAMLGYSESQAQRWWRCYVDGGLDALVQVGTPSGRRERITPAAWAALEGEVRAGRIGRLKEAQAYLRERWGISYCLDAISKLFMRRKTKLKTGSPDVDSPILSPTRRSKRRLGRELAAH